MHSYIAFVCIFGCLAVVREQREDLNVRRTEMCEAFRYRVWGLAVCPPKRCGCVSTQGCGCVPTQGVWLYVPSGDIAVCPPKNCGCVSTQGVWLCAHLRAVAVCLLNRCGCVPTQEVWLCARKEMQLCAHPCRCRGVAVYPTKRCGYVPTKRCGCVPIKGCGCVPTQEVCLCVHLEV